MAADFGNLPFKCAYTGFPCVITDNVTNSRFSNRELRFFQTIALHLFGQQITLCNARFLVFRITGQADDFHSVQKGRRNIVGIGCCDKHHIRQVEIHLDIVIGKRMILFRIQHFQQRRCRISPEIGTDLVHLIQQEKRIAHTGLDQALQNLAGHGSDIGTAVPADLRLITDPPQSHSYILAIGCTCYGLSERSLAYPGRSDQNTE